MPTYTGVCRGTLWVVGAAFFASPILWAADPPRIAPTAARGTPVAPAALRRNQSEEMERFKALVGTKNLADFELDWRNYIEVLYKRETRGTGKTPASVPLAAAGEEVESWPVDRLVIDDKQGGLKVLEGWIRGETAQKIDFLAIDRGLKGISWIGRPTHPADVVKREDLSKEQRARLVQLKEEYEKRDEIETLEKQKLVFGSRQDDAKRQLTTYRGNGFELESTADDETIRTSVVRIDQQIKAYRKLLSPRPGVQPSRPLKILLLGSAREYQKYLNDAGLRVASPAFYSPATNQIVSYSEAERMRKDWDAAALQNRNRADDLTKSKEQLKEELAAYSKDLRKKGFPEAEIRRLNRLRQAEHAAKSSRIDRQIEAYQRRNQKTFDDLMDRMYRVLYHELFHAYLESYVYDHRRHDVPVWLNEGLAQIVENGRLEGGQLRIDAPDPERLARLYADLTRRDPLTLVGLFQARSEAFLGVHGPEKREMDADRYYLYSWGLAYYLAFEKRSLGTKALDTFVTRQAEPAAPVEAE